MNAKDLITKTLTSCRDAVDRLLTADFTLAQIERAGEALAACLRHDKRVYSCGNGGSMCDAMHFAEELTGRFRDDRPPLPAMAISDPGYISCAANDYGYNEVFARFIQAHGRKGDILLAISTSGESANVIAAAHAAKKIGMDVIALTGRPDCTLGKLAAIDICTPGPTKYADRVQELHIKCIHILIDLVEQHLFSSGAKK